MAQKRPTLLVLDIGDADIVLAPITTTKRTAPGDYELRDWLSETGLLKKSWVRLAKVSCLEKRAIVDNAPSHHRWYRHAQYANAH